MQKHVCVQLYKHQGWEQFPVLFYFILFKNLFKSRQRRLAVGMLLTSSVLSTTSKQCFELTSSVLSTTSKQCFELTSSVLSTTSKQCFEQPAASFLVCSLIFIEYKTSKSARNPRQDNPDAGCSFKKISIYLTSNL